jgi:NAD(P)H dehydrogenase (quinone)
MKHAVIAAHPDPESFTMSVARSYCEAVQAQGHEPLLRDLYGMDFDPRLKASEIAGRKDFGPAPDAEAERATLKDADVFCFVYPFWINAPPAILKGYIDRIFGLGFAYGPKGSANQPLLTGKSMISFTSSGAPTEWVRETGAWDAERKLFDRHIAQLSGLDVLDHVHFGGIVPGIRADVVERHLGEVRAAVAKYF